MTDGKLEVLDKLVNRLSALNNLEKTWHNLLGAQKIEQGSIAFNQHRAISPGSCQVKPIIHRQSSSVRQHKKASP